MMRAGQGTKEATEQAVKMFLGLMKAEPGNAMAVNAIWARPMRLQRATAARSATRCVTPTAGCDSWIRP